MFDDFALAFDRATAARDLREARRRWLSEKTAPEAPSSSLLGRVAHCGNVEELQGN